MIKISSKSNESVDLALLTKSEKNVLLTLRKERQILRMFIENQKLIFTYD